MRRKQHGGLQQQRQSDSARHARHRPYVAISNRMLNEFYFMRGAASDRSYLNKDYAPKHYQQVVTIPASMGGGTIIGTSIYRFPSLIWGTYQCLPPCVAGAGTRTTFTEAQEALSITTGKHSWKLGGSIQLFPTHEWAPGNIFGTWTFNQDQYFNPSDPNFNIANLKGATLFQASFPNLRREMRNHSYAVYVMDEVEAGPRPDAEPWPALRPADRHLGRLGQAV